MCVVVCGKSVITHLGLPKEVVRRVESLFLHFHQYIASVDIHDDQRGHLTLVLWKMMTLLISDSLALKLCQVTSYEADNVDQLLVEFPNVLLTLWRINVVL